MCTAPVEESKQYSINRKPTASVYPYHTLDESSTMYACWLDGLKDVYHTLSFQPLQLGVDTDEGSSATNTITEISIKRWGACTYDFGVDAVVAILSDHAAKQQVAYEAQPNTPQFLLI